MGVADGVRLLFRGALVIFILTIVIGILNGLDVWEVPHDILLTHVHSGTLGWITLGVFGAAAAMLGRSGESIRTMAWFGVIAMAAYILAFGSVEFTTGTSIQRPIGGTLALISIIWFFVWAIRAKSFSPSPMTTKSMKGASGSGWVAQGPPQMTKGSCSV